ncbi:heparan sulfate glucosamine 3-O-sulfotransferase 1-like [Amphiura filiformis]|uniref:heparan sulfate glucosamine 3-O-sulfotransferase 1-like n=1 Tax=Amphiura filiformis TaxID=82378 RepID=UPI003B21BDEB
MGKLSNMLSRDMLKGSNPMRNRCEIVLSRFNYLWMKVGIVVTCTMIILIALDWFFKCSNVIITSRIDINNLITSMRFNATTFDVIERNSTCYLDDDPFSIRVLPKEYLNERGCEKRLPSAIIIGGNNCRTNDLTFYLRHHPHIVFPKSTSIEYFDKFFDLPLSWYRNQMPFSLQNQITMESTSSYLTSSKAPFRVHDALLSSNLKFIVVACDPVIRALRDFKQQQEEEINWLNATLAEKLFPFHETFMSCIFKPNGELQTQCPLLFHGNYLQHLLKWMQYFSSQNFIVVNEEDVIFKPFRVLQKIEHFIGIPNYFQFDDFKFDLNVGSYCLKTNNRCISSSKDEELPKLSPDITRKLRQYFLNSDKVIQNIFDVRLPWLKNETVP